jgi:hypothetical protein
LSNEAATALIQFTRERESVAEEDSYWYHPVDSTSHIPLRYLTSHYTAVNGNESSSYTSPTSSKWESSPWADDPFNYTEVVALKCRPVEEFLNYDWDWDWDWEALLAFVRDVLSKMYGSQATCSMIGGVHQFSLTTTLRTIVY